MGMTPEQTRDWFKFDASYQNIKMAEVNAVLQAFAEAAVPLRRAVANRPCSPDTIDDIIAPLARVIDESAPDCPDKTAAIRSLRLARAAAQEAGFPFTNGEGMDRGGILKIIGTELIKARWQTLWAIVYGGK